MKKFSWKILKSERRAPWSLLSILAIISISSSVFLFSVGNNFGGALFLVAPLVLSVVAIQGQRDIDVHITEDKIKINQKEIPFKKVSFYSIIADRLLIKPKEEAIMYIPIHPEDIDKIEAMLSEKIKKEEYEENINQIINRLLRIY